MSDKRAVMPIPTDVWAAIQEGPNGDERLNDEWKRRELFALRIAQMAYKAGGEEFERELAELRKATIEECAKVCDDLADHPFFKVGAVMQKAAEAIRALKASKPSSP